MNSALTNKIMEPNKKLLEQAEIEYCKPSFEVNKFSSQIGDSRFSFQILKSEASLLIVIGVEGADRFVDLSLAMPTSYDRMPIVTSILGDSTSNISSNFAKRISHVLGKPVFISFNATADRLVLPLLEKNLIQQIKDNPSLFK